MLDFFSNPGYLAAAAALVSVPIIIHLINRMRFKRIRWAAMEFLLKAQKRNRRRLIIEQLLLLALRCILVALAGFLVLRFVGFSLADFAAKQPLHIALIDDTLSMQDQLKEGDKTSDSFQRAQQALRERVVKKLSQVNSKDRLIIVPLSKAALEPDWLPTVHENLFDNTLLKAVEQEVNELTPTKLHVNPLHGFKRVEQIVNDNVESRIAIYYFSDFRAKDWSGPDGEALFKQLQAMTDSADDLKIFHYDTAHPDRTSGQTMPLAHDSIGLTELRAGTRVAGRAMPVSFSTVITNYSGREAEVRLRVYDDVTGTEQANVDFNPPMPVKVPAFSNLPVSFEMRFNPTLRAGETHFERISVRLKNPQLGELEGDGLLIDNVRHAAVEIREKVPILIIDGEGSKGRQENNDSFFLRTAIVSVPGASYEVVYGDELGGGVAVKALERADLHKFPTIFMANVRELSAKQAASLEAYVKDGGGVAFFMGPLVNAKAYNKDLYKDGTGVLPAPLKETYFPPPNEPPLEPEYTGEPMLILREDQIPDEASYPIFGQMFKDRSQREFLKDLPVRRFWQVPRANWQPEPGKVFELATLPNEAPITAYTGATIELLRGPRLEKILAQDEYKPYRRGFERHRRAIETLIAPGSPRKAYHLAHALDQLLFDKGRPKEAEEYPNLTEFWSSSDPKIRTLREEIVRLRDQVRYGDPFIVAQQFGKGRVVAVMSTAGKEWNDWPGGSQATLIYQPFIWEMQNWLSSQGGEGNLAVGVPTQIVIDPEQFKQKGRQLKMVRYGPKREGEKTYPKEESFGVQTEGGLVFSYPKSHDPGLYVSELHYADGEAKTPLMVFGQVFNVDTAREGPLQRLSYDDMFKNLISGREGSIRFLGAGALDEDLVVRQSDFSESPLLFLIFLGVLVAEQALAVHLSFHLRGNEAESLAQMLKPRQQPAAA